MDLAGRKAIKELEGVEDKYLDEYATPGTDRYNAMIEKIRESIGVDSLQFQHLDDLVEAIGLPKEKLWYTLLGWIEPFLVKIGRHTCKHYLVRG